jgi:hypothetical protein
MEAFCCSPEIQNKTVNFGSGSKIADPHPAPKHLSTVHYRRTCQFPELLLWNLHRSSYRLTQAFNREGQESGGNSEAHKEKAARRPPICSVKRKQYYKVSTPEM